MNHHGTKVFDEVVGCVVSFTLSAAEERREWREWKLSVESWLPKKAAVQ